MTSFPLVGPVEPPGLHVMTLNVRRRMPRLRPGSPDRWSARAPLLARLLDAERPALLGLQEVMPDQSREITRMLGAGYASIGSGRDAGRSGERLELRVDRERLRVESSRAWWLSDTPDIPGSRSFGNLVPRMVLSAALLDLGTGVRFHALVTHLDHLSERSRRASADAIAREVSTLEGPVVVVGDFNTGADSPAHLRLTTGSRLRDSFALAPSGRDLRWGSYSRYRLPVAGGRRLDWILVTEGTVVETAGVSPARFAGRAVSDHEPVHAVVRWDGGQPPESRLDG